MKLKVLSLFSGIGAFEKALSNLGVDYEVVNYCEVDEKASKAYSLLHNVSESLNLGDITKVNADSLPDFDLMTYGFPCQDVSVANVYGEGLEGERSGLLYYALDIAKAKKPKYMIAENVKNLVGKKHSKGFKEMLDILEGLGYNNYWKVLDSKDFGVPQERKRVFVVSIRKDVDNGLFSYPSPRPTTPWTQSWWEFIDISDCRNLTGRQQRMVDVAKGINKDDSIEFEGTVQFDKAVITLRQSGLRFQANPYHPTITAYYGRGGGNFTILAYKGQIGGITPRQCFKLMGFEYSDHDLLAENGISVSDLYALAGNSIVVNVLEDIFANLFKRAK